MTTTLRASRDQVFAFRLESHNLNERRPAGSLLDAAAVCGFRNTPPGSAALAAHARVADLSPDAIDRALGEDKTLIEVLGMRSSPHVIPTRDLEIFTLGALPATEESLRAALPALAPALDEAGMSAAEALRLAADAAREALDSGVLARGALSEAMTRRLPEVLSPWCKGCGTRHVYESLFRLAGVCGAFSVAPRAGKGSAYVRIDRWIARAGPGGDRAAARAELLRRYLRGYGPSTSGDFAAWAGITPADARQSWDQIAEQLVAVDVDGRRAWLHADDVARFERPAPPAGVRLLPPYDAYLDQRDRVMLLPDTALHRRLWQAIGNPGAVLADGQIIGLWRPQKKGRRLLITVELFAAASPATRATIAGEAALLAPFRGCASAEIVYAE